ncbi:dihydrodipicolinate reductase C-terminal domain-containing protein, partial [Acinetobacter baumannii]
SVTFLGPFERLTLSHLAEDRMLFAHGALKAALCAHGKNPGHYSMADVLGLADI